MTATPRRGGVFSFDVEAIESPDARRLLAAYQAELGRRFDMRVAVSTENHPEEFRPPRGVFLVVRRDGAAVGCGGVRPLPDGTGELKRMFLDESVRGMGAGRQLLTALEEHAAAAGYEVLRLDSRLGLTTAIAMYRSAGYREIPPYNDNPDAQIWMERSLVGGAV